MAKKKKTVHWSKLPRAKLISTVKRLELQYAKLKTQLAEQRETRLLNHSIGALAVAEDFEGVVHVTQDDWQNANQDAVVRGELFPWEKK